MIAAGYTAVPNAIFEDPGFIAVPPASRVFLIELYRLYGDCDTFVVEPKSIWNKKLSDLLLCGLVVIDGRLPGVGKPGTKTRRFRFRHSVVAAYE